MQKHLILLIAIALVTVTFAGCTNSAPSTMMTPTPTPGYTPIPTLGNPNINKYNSGAQIQKDTNDSAYNKEIAWVIVKVNDDGQYSIEQVFYDSEARKWYKVDGGQVSVHDYRAVERDYPILMGTVDWDNLPIKYNVKGVDGYTRVQWNLPATPTPIPENSTRVNAEGFFHITGIDNSKRLANTMDTVEVTNLGSIDAENVQVYLTWSYQGRPISHKTLYFGTVKVGVPVKKEFVMELPFSEFDWAQYQQFSRNEAIKMTLDNITGDNVIKF